MADRHDYVALDWVKGEIEEVLKQAQYELEAFAESPDDTARMKFCLTYLHQVRGTLQMVEFYGAAMLAEEMEAVVQAMLDDKVSHAAEAREVLMQAILQLPNYLDHIKLGRRDLPVVLLPVLNDLRGARGESLLSETSLFQPRIERIEPINDVQKNKFSDKQVFDLVRKLRQMYQVALLGVLKGKDLDRNIEYLQKVTTRLAKLLQGAPAQSLWSVASAVFEGISHQGIAVNSAIKELLKQLDAELKSFVNHGPSSLNQVPQDLLKNLLFYVAKCDVETPLVETIKNEFNLRDALPSSSDVNDKRKALDGPDKATMGSVAHALIEEINTLKEQLDVLVQDKVAEPDNLSLLLPGFKQISDTMGMLGLGTPRKVIQEQYEILHGFVSDRKSASNTQLMDIAGGLLYVEASLLGLSDKFGAGEVQTPSNLQLGEAQRVVLRESKQLIEQVKDLVVEYATKNGELSLLGDAGELMMNLRGTLIMVPQIEAADIARICSNILQNHVHRQERPKDVLLDALAEALSGIEYFIERLEENSQSGGADILGKARKAILPFIPASDIAEADGTLAPEVFEDDLEEVEVVVTPTDDLMASEEAVDESVNNDAAEASITIQDMPEDESIELVEISSAKELNNELSESLQELNDLEGLELEDEMLSAALDDALDAQLIEIDGTESEAIPEIESSDLDDDDDLIDDEIIEIFLEEAQEVLEAIIEFWPIFKENNSDEDALANTRRAFHTLKGSGRMVGAQEIGETAWSIENMFNRLLDHTIVMTPNFVDIVDFMVEQIPALISAFEQKRATDVDILAIQEYANAISAGDDVDAWQAPEIGVTPDVTPELPILDFDEDDSEILDIEIAPESPEPTDPKEILMDPALLDVFSSEVESHITVLQAFIEKAQQEEYSTPIDDVLQRALHTLKGSAHMAHIEAIADIAGSLENFAKDLCAYHVEMSAEIVHLFIRGKDLVDDGFQQLSTTPFAKIAGSEDLTADVQRLSQQLIADFHQRLGTSGNNSVDPQVLNIFLSEGMDILLDVENMLERWQKQPDDSTLLLSIIDEVQTLEKGAAMADLLPIVNLCEAIITAYQRVLEQSVPADDAFIDVIKEGLEGLLNMMDMVAASQAIVQDKSLLAELSGDALELPNISLVPPLDAEIELDLPELDLPELDLPEIELDIQPEQAADIDPELLEIFLEEAQELTLSISASLLEWEQDRNNLLQVAELQRDLHTLKGGARMAEINAIGDLAHELEDLYEGLSLGRLTANDHLFDLLVLCHDRLKEMVTALVAGSSAKSAPELITAIELFIAGESLDLPEVAVEALPIESTITPEVDVAADQPVSVAVTDMAIEADAEVAEIFMDEAEELMAQLDDVIQKWQEEPTNSDHNEAIQRVLHTLKGGAFMAGLKEIGELAHHMESELQDRLVKKQSADAPLFSSLHSQYDFIASRIDSVVLWLKQGAKDGTLVEPVATRIPTPISSIATTSESTAAQSAPTESATNARSNVVPLRAITDAQKAAAQEDASRRTQPQEMIKVPAELLDGLVNLAGETSISRGRLENQVTDFAFTLEEMDATLDRLKDQLRRLDIETEAQVLFRQERHGPNYEDFDPLEMDRYSQLQQLSRSLVESASDLMDLKGTLLDKTRDAETLLLQQSRVNTELQEGLMKTRMVPFSRLVPRLRRIVRQVSQELGKQVELQVNNAEGEMDRSVLERLITPLEHMLRNAVDHGLENDEVRRLAGKAEVGIISLSLFRDGGDVVLKLVDDGAGINLAAVRNKAVERGLIMATEKISDQDLLQFILHAGFSTAQKVTQISGRGVGMDVVNSEIKQVGGSIVINSVEGKGSEFVIRLPFTVSVNRALMTRVGDALFAIPLNSIEGIVRISVDDLRELYKQEKPVYQYAGRDYPLEYLGSLLRDDTQNRLPEGNTSMPVVLVRGAQPAAVQVDTLMGSREIVVKALGPQFSSVVGVSGGTILGDGSVVIILDLPNMMRHVHSLEYKEHIAMEYEEEAHLQHLLKDSVTSVLVVDDSVTVRKVTTRLLERHGMEVRTAKDGIDAMEILQDYRPDVMLLDIEMPRMDGFEVATQMRHDSRLKDVPIIMITSRTGDKHKERAMDIGVTDYMGKPFQEEKLLGSIRTVVGKAQ
jgi:chemosensory pili system protein ChpA (sensor histidine kinase/response regulator)